MDRMYKWLDVKGKDVVDWVQTSGIVQYILHSEEQSDFITVV